MQGLGTKVLLYNISTFYLQKSQPRIYNTKNTKKGLGSEVDGYKGCGMRHKPNMQVKKGVVMETVTNQIDANKGLTVNLLSP